MRARIGGQRSICRLRQHVLNAVMVPKFGRVGRPERSLYAPDVATVASPGTSGFQTVVSVSAVPWSRQAHGASRARRSRSPPRRGSCRPSLRRRRRDPGMPPARSCGPGVPGRAEAKLRRAAMMLNSPLGGRPGPGTACAASAQDPIAVALIDVVQLGRTFAEIRLDVKLIPGHVPDGLRAQRHPVSSRMSSVGFPWFATGKRTFSAMPSA